jgi:predicted transposase/invertase (TIGR01784 family)
MTKGNLVRFDWAAKRLLRQKANFVVLEGLLSVLLDDKIKIVRMLESEGNKESADGGFNRVDMLAESSSGELIIIEVQNYRELVYFQRMLYGVSKLITEYFHESEDYSNIKKVYSVNVLYFNVGQGADYLYRGRTDFWGVFTKDKLMLSAKQRKQFGCIEVGDLHPEYFILRVNGFDKVAETPLDEWFSFLKTGEIPDNAKAPGLPEAKERLKRDRMSSKEQKEYDAHLEALRYQKSVLETSYGDGEDKGRMEGKMEEKTATVIRMSAKGKSIEDISDATSLSTHQIQQIIDQHQE